MEISVEGTGKPIVPLNLALAPEEKGARKLYNYGLTSSATPRLFRTVGDLDPHIERARGDPGDRRGGKRH